MLWRTRTPPTAIVPPSPEEGASNPRERENLDVEEGRSSLRKRAAKGRQGWPGRSRGSGDGDADDARGMAMGQGGAGRRGERKGEKTRRRHTMQVTARAPHRPCLISFVPGVSSAFFPMTARQPWHGSASSRPVSALRRTEIAQMETSVSFSLRLPVTLLPFLLLSIYPFISVVLLAHLRPALDLVRIKFVFTNLNQASAPNSSPPLWESYSSKIKWNIQREVKRSTYYIILY